MKFSVFIIVTFLLCGCLSKEIPKGRSFNAQEHETFNYSAMAEDSIMKNDALRSYREQYVKEKTHKAFAQSENGSWSWRADRTTEKFAIKNALQSCRDLNLNYEDNYPCKIINIDGIWVGNINEKNSDR